MKTISMPARTNFFEKKNADYRMMAINYETIAQEELYVQVHTGSTASAHAHYSALRTPLHERQLMRTASVRSPSPLVLASIRT